MNTKPNLRACAIALSIALLSGCASTLPSTECPKPAPLPADLAQPLPPEGWFQDQVAKILSCGRDPTSDPHCSELLGEPTK